METFSNNDFEKKLYQMKKDLDERLASIKSSFDKSIESTKCDVVKYYHEENKKNQFELEKNTSHISELESKISKLSLKVTLLEINHEVNIMKMQSDLAILNRKIENLTNVEHSKTIIKDNFKCLISKSLRKNNLIVTGIPTVKNENLNKIYNDMILHLNLVFQTYQSQQSIVSKGIML